MEQWWGKSYNRETAASTEALAKVEEGPMAWMWRKWWVVQGSNL
jgi:hypothetical protein